MTGNQTSRRCFAYQSAVGLEAINAAADVTYLLGAPDENIKWSVPTMKTPTDAYYNYASREPLQTPLDSENKPFITTFIPTTPQYFAWMMKQVTEDGIGANVHEIEALDSGLPLPLTFRFGLLEGSVDRIFQAVDCYCVGLSWSGGYNKPLIVSPEWIFGRLEDRRGEWKLDDTCASRTANTITLTDDALAGVDTYAGYLVFVDGGDHEDDVYTVVSNTNATPTVLTVSETTGASLAGDTLKLFDKLRPTLTTPPIMPGETSPKTTYQGTPEVYWDVADQNVQLVECQAASGNQRQNYKTVLDGNNKYETISLYKHEPIQLTLECIFERHKQVYDYIDRKSNQINIKFYKADSSYYILKKFYGCEIVDWTEEGPPNMGHYLARVNIKASSVIGEFTIEDETNWGTHYKTVA